MNTGKPAGFLARLSLKKIVLAVLVIVLALVGVKIVHGSGSGHTSGKRHHAAHHSQTKTHSARKGHASACPRTKGKKATRCARAPHHPAAHRKSHGRVAHRTKHVRRYRPTKLQRYAMSLLPMLNHHAKTFDFVAYDTSIKTLDQLDSACNRFLNRISVMTGEVDGVPHPGVWYSTVARLHWRVLGVYHNMQSALEVCATGASNQDGESVATARQDLVTAVRKIHALDRYAQGIYRRVQTRIRQTTPAKPKRHTIQPHKQHKVQPHKRHHK